MDLGMGFAPRGKARMPHDQQGASRGNGAGSRPQDPFPEAAEFTTWTPHWIGAVAGPVELIAIFGPQGERLHLHA
jgi:hypothetical protein